MNTLLDMQDYYQNVYKQKFQNKETIMFEMNDKKLQLPAKFQPPTAHRG